MAAAEQQLQSTAFLLGDRPTAVDCIVLAGLRAHFLYDPAPRRELIDRYPLVVDWVNTKADQWSGNGDTAPLPDCTPFVHVILSEMANTYRHFALANQSALAGGDKAFVIPMYGEEVSYLARPYIEKSRRMLAERYRHLCADGCQHSFDTLSDRYGLIDLLTL
jgi:hypothetical protein